MANIKANKKSILTNKKRYLRNKSNISSLKTAVKKSRSSKDSKTLVTVYKKADSLLSKGTISKNKASRIKSRTAIALNRANSTVDIPKENESK